MDLRSDEEAIKTLVSFFQLLAEIERSADD